MLSSSIPTVIVEGDDPRFTRLEEYAACLSPVGLDAPRDVFRREGNDLHTTVTITLVQALVGFEKTVKHLDEHPVDIVSKGITKPKEVRKFKGEGMPVYHSMKKGDLYVTFEVLLPTSLTEDQKSKKSVLD